MLLCLGWEECQHILPGFIVHLMEVCCTKFVEYYVVDFCFSFGLVPGAQLHVPSPLPANQSSETSLLINTSMFQTRFMSRLRVSKLYLCVLQLVQFNVWILLQMSKSQLRTISMCFTSAALFQCMCSLLKMVKWVGSVKYITFSVMHLLKDD